MFEIPRSLTHLNAVLSVEALAVHRPNAGMLDKLGHLFDDVTDHISTSVGKLKPHTGVIDFRPAFKTTTQHRYVDLSPIQMPTPAGLSVSYLEYGLLLKEAQALVSGIYDNTLYPFLIYLGSAINSPDKLGSVSFKHQIRKLDLNDIQSKLSASMRNATRATQPYGKVVRQNGEWDQLKEVCYTLQKTMDTTPIKLINDTVERVDEQMHILISKIKDTNEQFRPSPAVIKELADASFLLAEQVSFYSVITTMVSAYLQAIEDATETLAKVK